MNFIARNMDENSAKLILSWRYKEPYNFYNNESNSEALKELLDGSYRVITDDHGEIFGFMCTGESAQVPAGNKYGVYNKNCVDMGLGMAPDHVGKGNGYPFCSFIINYIRENHGNIAIRLSVATFNKRAVYLYEKLGFKKADQFRTDHAEFITMIKEPE